jgi:hydroxyethylthiazole kinase-like uncharacterized protein yjeF
MHHDKHEFIDLPDILYTAAQVRELDRRAIEEHGMPGAMLMQRAGQAAFELLRAKWPRARRLAVLCGPGNNGGDGYVVARLAREAGLAPVLIGLGDVQRMKGDAAAARQACEAAGMVVHDFDSGLLAGNEVIVDALLGTGLEREVNGEWRAAIEAVNDSRLPVLAVDIPSGLHADTGRIMGAAVRAHATITFIGLKAGLFTGAGREQAGAVFFDDLGVPADLYEKVEAAACRLSERVLAGLLRRRRRDLHKGEAGCVLVIGGDRGMPGAVRMAAEAAYRAGAGLVIVATHPQHAAQMSAARPELITYGVETAADLRPLFTRASVIAIGPGLGSGEWGQGLFGAALEAPVPLVADADALNLLAADPLMRPDWILTPHPGEAARLLGLSVRDVQADRFTAVREIAGSYGGVCVLKGSGTLIAALDRSKGSGAGGRGACTRQRVAVCDRGNPGMASGGMGDVLTGVIAGLRAQGLAAADAARLGVWLHAAAGDDAAVAGEIGLLACDLLPYLRTRLNRLVEHGGG